MNDCSLTKEKFHGKKALANNKKYRNPKKAFQLPPRVVKEFPCSVSYDTLAAVYAAKKDFSNAVLYQKKAIELLNKTAVKDIVFEKYLMELTKRLKVYENKKEWNNPNCKHRSFSIDP